MERAFSSSDRPESFGFQFIVGLSGPELDDWDKRILSSLKPAGVLLLKRNFLHDLDYRRWTAGLSNLLEQIKEYSENSKPIISLDHEGGHVIRTPAPITQFPYAEKFGNDAAAVACAMASELQSMGVNLSWAPVADIHSNPANPIIGKRAFATEPHTVAEGVVAFERAMYEAGVMTCAKHFPGHGDTSTDSHLELPMLTLTEAELFNRELIPFKALIDAGVPTIMTAHIMFPKIDPLYPATMSSRILTEILRGRLAYNRIIISDDVDMEAVTRSFNRDDMIGLAVNAGCDMFIVARHPKSDSDRPVALAKMMARCLSNGVVSEARLFESFTRVKSFVESELKQSSVGMLDEQTLAQHGELARSLSS